MSKDRIAILLMAYGGPGSLDEVEAYVMDIRGGRPTPPELIVEVENRYRKIGGKSPILEISRTQAMALNAELERQGIHSRTFVGMRHWYPYIREAVRAIGIAGLSRVVALCLTPQYSEMSVGAYFHQYRLALEDSNLDLQTTYIKSWHNHPDLLRAFASKTEEALLRFPKSQRKDLPIVFTAHSLPERVLVNHDPYDDQVKETAAGVAQLLNNPRWTFAYQSQGFSQEKWLGPRVEEVLSELAAEGNENVLLAPIGFVCDHVEILHDVDISFQEYAASRGMRLERPKSLNDNPLFIRALTKTICSHLRENA